MLGTIPCRADFRESKSRSSPPPPRPQAFGKEDLFRFQASVVFQIADPSLQFSEISLKRQDPREERQNHKKQKNVINGPCSSTKIGRIHSCLVSKFARKV